MAYSVQFLPNPARKPEGLGDGGIEQFRGKPHVSCARETGQNSNDAGSKDGDKPVVMKFNLHHIDRDDLPFADELHKACKHCLADSEDKAKRMDNDPEEDRTVQFFRRAVKETGEEAISVLEIADFNTTGLTGPMDDSESVFNSLVKADGVNNKRSDDSGGAFGIGKKAAFATSNVQTVLYSTLTEDPQGSELFGIQARLQLLSHEREAEPFRAEGYWGNPNFAPITDPAGLPDWMVRKERGTSLFVVCFPAQKNWARKMEISILTNFTTAIFRGKMEFEIDDGGITINKATLSQRLGSSDMDEIAKDVGLTEQLGYARHILKCLSSGETQKFTFEVEGYGEADLRILVEPELPRHILMVRNGMYITNHLRGFDQPLVHFAQTREFVAILEPAGSEGGRKFGALLKRLENPEHNAFEPSRIISDEEQGRVETSIQQLVRAAREKIKEAAKVETSDSDDIDELAHLFAAEAGDEDTTSSGESDPERFTYGQAKTKTRKMPNIQIDPEGGDLGGSGDKDKTTEKEGGGGQGKGSGTGTGGEGTGSPRKPIQLAATRICDITTGGTYVHELHFTPEGTGPAEITVAASGLTTASELQVAKVGLGQIEKGKIRLELEAGKRVSICFNLAESFHGPMELSAMTISETVKSAS
ncbi:hypothetical protein HUO14_14575 [Parasphingorhabdus flavimaris]|uniref:ATP-binding protein n=1 Tax=Parasphingorhabdus flavimaris TaxID=266812 RepID=A0ABX2N5X4_9SPHN|nr:hypothetical protein [Parasphingorhabdus flavimaris]NVD29121.1 hypothetical protein [Parasphingorhabdus flavimaris]